MAEGLELGILISGRGSNMGAILDAIEAGRLRARARVVISSRADAPGLAIAAGRGVPTRVLAHGDYPHREGFDRALAEALAEAGASCVVLAGFMRVVGPVLLRAFPDRIVNVHPSLLPAFPGMRAQAQALAHGVKIAGCTVHLVDEGVDTGPILAQRAVEVRDDDTEETLSARILGLEHALLVETLARLAEGRLVVERPEGRRPRARIEARSPGEP